MQRQTLKPFPEEPNTDTVPAMLTPGEFVIRKDAVDAIGVDKLNLMNNIDRLSMLSSLMEYRPSGYQEGGEVMLKTKKENLPNPGLKALFDSGAKGKEALENMGFQDGGKVMNYADGGKVMNYADGGKVMNYADGGKVMNYYGGGRVMDMMNPNMMRRGMMGGGKVESDTLSVFGDKSAAADKMNMIMTLQSMRMQQGGMVPGMIPPQEMPAPSLPPAGMMMQEGGMVEQPMPQGEMSDVDMSMMPDAERAFPSEPMEQMNLKPNEMMAYQEYGPESFRYMAPKFKPRAEFTPYDAMVDAGIVDPYETSEDDFVIMTRDMANNLRGMNGV